MIKPIVDFNKHWIGQTISVPNETRLIFNEILNKLNTGLITFLIGPRRVGKSTLLKQVLNHLLIQKKVKPTQIFFYEFEPSHSRDDFDSVISEYFQTKLDKSENFYLLLDEVQFVKNYELSLKYLIDLYPQIRILITGSLSLGYKRKMAESLAGRLLQVQIYPLCFEEYLMLSNSKELNIFIKAKSDKSLWSQASIELNPKFQEFLKTGTYPQAIFWPKEIPLSDFLDTIVNQSLSQDAMNFFNLDRSDLILNLYKYLAINNGSEVSLNSLSNELGANILTIRKYLDVLELLGLIYIVKNTLNPLKIPNSKSKIYINSIFENSWIKSNQNNLGKSVESYVLERLLNGNNQITFFRERNKEIDFLNHTQKEILEIKYRLNIDTKGLDFLELQSKKLKYKPVVVTFDQIKIQNLIYQSFELKPACFV